MNPRLHFDSYAGIAARVADTLASARGGEPLSPWSHEVIVASGGVSQAIAARVLDQFPAGVAGLRLGTIESFAARVLNAAGESPRVANDTERRLAMRSAAHAVQEPLTETRGAAAMLARTYRDVRDSGITVEQFASRVAGAGSLRNRARLRTIVRVWQDYDRLVARMGLIDPADLLARAAAKVRGGADVAPQLLAGFYDMTGAQMGLVAALRDVEKLAAVLVPVSADRPAPFAQNFINAFDPSSVPSPQSPALETSFTVIERRTREEEIESVCASVASLLGAGTTSIGIVTRSLDAYDAQLFERFASQLGFATTSAAPVPLAAQRIGRGIMLLLRLRERGFHRSDVLEIVRSGLRVRTRIDVDKADAETRQALIAGGTSAELSGRAYRGLAVKDYIDLVAELEELTANIDAGWLRRVIDMFRIETGADLAAVEQLDEIAAVLTRTTVWNRPFDPSDLADALMERHASRPPAAAALPQVWLGDVMRFRGRTFDHVFAVRMQEDVLPQRRNEDPLLSDSDRRELRVREIGNGRDEEQLLFQLLCGGAAHAIHFSLAASDGLGKLLRPSQYLKNFVIEQRPEAKGEVLRNFSRAVRPSALGLGPSASSQGPTPKAQGPLRPLQLLARAGTSGPFDGIITSERVLARAAKALESISPTQLEDFGECPQKFLVKHVLRVRDIDDPEREVQINHREKGSIDHRILEHFYRGLTAEDFDAAALALPRLPEHLGDRLDALVEEEFERFDSERPAYNRHMRAIERKATQRNLRDFVSDDLTDLVSRGMRPKHFEYRFGAKWLERDLTPDYPEPYLIDAAGVRLRVEGMIDRIDTDGTAFRIVDYKSGKAGRHGNLAAKVDRGVRLQLAVYALAVSEFFAAADVSAAIKPLVSSDAGQDKFSFSLAGKRERLLETLGIFVSAVLRGAFPAYPRQSDSDFNSCKYCPVNHSCRTRHDAAESRAVLRSDDPRSLLELLP